MKTPAEVVASLTGCFLCGGTIVLVAYVIPTSDGAYSAFMKLREEPISDEHTPTFGYGLCGEHASDVGSAARVEAKIMAAAAQVVAH